VTPTCLETSAIIRHRKNLPVHRVLKTYSEVKELLDRWQYNTRQRWWSYHSSQYRLEWRSKYSLIRVNLTFRILTVESSVVPISKMSRGVDPFSRTVTGSAMACQSGQVDEMFSQFTVVSGQYNRTDRVKARELGH
jgi:hypothetical protein